MANQRIDQLNAETTPAAADLLPLFSISGSDTKKITLKNLVQQGAALIDDGSIPGSKVNLGAGAIVLTGVIVNADVNANAEIAVSKLADGSARQLLQTDSAGTGVEWASNIDIPGTLDITGAAIFDSTVAVTGALTKSGSNVVTVGDTGTVTSAMILNDTIVDADISATAEISVSKLVDGAPRQLLQTDAAGTGVEWASNIDIPGTLDVTSAATFDSSVAVTGALTKSGNNVVTVGDSGTVTSAMLLDGTIVDADINASAEISVSKLVDGSARQLLQTDAAGTGVEWASNIDIPGTLDVTNAATFDSTVAVTGALTKSGNNVVTVGDTGTVTSTMLLDGTILDADINASAAIAYSKLATLTSGNIVLGSSAGVASSTSVTGDISISNTGVTSISSGVIVNADINASAAIADTKLDTIATSGKIFNSATTATDANTPSAIVARNASGNFTAGTITASLTGTASGNLVSGGALGTPSSGTLTSCTGLPISTGVSGLGTGAATFLATPSSANFAALLTDETGTGATVFATSPTLVTPALGTPTSGSLTNCTNLPVATSSVAGAVSIPAAGGLALTGGGALSHSNAVTGGASTRSGITFDAQGHIVSTVDLVSTDLPVATNAVKGAVIAGSGLTVDGNGVVAISVATSSVLGAIKLGTELTLNGTNQLELTAQGGIAGGTAYPKVTVNSKGIITAGDVLNAADIPSIDASKITTGSVDIARIAANTVTGAKLANYAISKIGDTTPTADCIGQFFFNPLSKDLALWDGNVFQPIGISVGEIVFAGTFNASTGSGTGLITSVTAEGTGIGLTAGAALPSASVGNSKYYVVVSTGGTVTTGNAPHAVLNPPDIILSNGTTWVEIDISQTFTTVTANQVSFAPFGNIASANVQAAIEELDTEKLPLAGGTITGSLEIGTTGTLSFEGATANAFETTIAVVDPTADRTITFPNISGTVITTGDTGSITSTMLLDGTIVDADVNASAAIAYSKLATLTSGNILVGSSANVATSTAVSGDVTISNTGVTAIASGVIVNADINASAAIEGSKIVAATTGVVGVTQLSDSTSTTSSVLAATPTAVKAAYDLAAAALPKSGGTVTGNLEIGTAGSLTFEGSTADAFELSLAIVDPTADRTITLPNETGTVIVSGNASIVNADINASAAIIDTKLATIATAGKVSNSATTAASANTLSAIVARDASGNFTAGTITAALTGTASGNLVSGGALGTPSSGTLTNCTFPTLNQSTTGNAATVTTNANLTGDVTSVGNATAIASGVIVDADINASAAIAGSKIVAATTSVVGAVQLSDSTSTTSSVLAATPTAVKAAYDLADAALPKAGGTVTGNVILDNQVDARFREATANGTNYVGFQAPATIAADVLWTLPATDGTSNQVLKTDGAGTLSWSTPTTGGVSLGLVIALS